MATDSISRAGRRAIATTCECSMSTLAPATTGAHTVILFYVRADE